ncbi:MAG: XRE family transcriptional regulator, partial [Acidobacteria bacterium]
MKWITADDLARWAKTLSAQSDLPALIKDLVRASATDIRAFRFPAGDSAQIPGWDGRLNSLSSSLYVPEGDSVWEMGTSADYLGKANGDYTKRTANPGAVDPAVTTFIFVTPHRWVHTIMSIDAWRKERLAEDLWKDVRAIDGAMLEDWIEQCPAVG